MINRPKLILLHGFAGIGKTTIAERYVNEHPLTLLLEAEKVGVMISRWLEYEAEARELLYKLGQTITVTYLESGHDVVIPMLPTNPKHVQTFERIARRTDARFFEAVLVAERQEAIRRLMKRGAWSEDSAAPITEADLPDIGQLYDNMDKTLAQRPNAIHIPSAEGDHDGTYQQFLAAVAIGEIEP